MFWSEDIPVLKHKDGFGRNTNIKIVSGKLKDKKALAPPPDSWAAMEEHDVAIFVITMEPNAHWTLPAASPGINRNLYFFEGESLIASGETIPPYKGMELNPALDVSLVSGATPSRLLLLQGKPINENVVQHGPFVMNSEMEIRQAMQDYYATQFGGWPWPSQEHVHPKQYGRFARYTDGTEEFRK